MNTRYEEVKRSNPEQASAVGSAALERWLLPLLGVPRRHRKFFNDVVFAHTLWFQATALVACAGAFAASTTMFSHVLIGNSLALSLPVGLMAGAALFVIDRQTLTELRIDPEGGRGKTWVIRIVTVGMGLMMGLMMAIVTHKEDIARLQAEKASVETARAIRSAEYASRADIVDSALEQATRDVSRKATLDAELTEGLGKLAEAESELAREISGAFDPRTGQTRKDGYGPKARYWETVHDGAGSKVRAIEAELRSMGDPAHRQAKAQTALKALQEEFFIRALQQQQEPAKKLGLLFQLLREEWSTWISLGFGLLLALFPEFIMLRAMTCFKRR